jgi:hypothetical protein
MNVVTLIAVIVALVAFLGHYARTRSLASLGAAAFIVGWSAQQIVLTGWHWIIH